ncbi:hypothetical protein SAMN04490243_1225 [Robiginitalea myxolifaciens]|uniref:FAD dependent oxidoreductase domain-containing protein n=1 Tax=Robiginitalea myxolifaciens TaxID=400055 RepID=A0A1I6G4D8_9FLAO|nr:FAD-dependent oxidoreductase [Robiginitalea myxolifaciens]SFR37073.1 hypothetical protein SAMN04490243_1225 [Robiginitalea myxolifaciens]
MSQSGALSFSYWETKTWLAGIDYCIVGSGITGLSCALKLRQLKPDARIAILERGVLPYGASTRNAGFACFGSPTEILDDLNTHSEAELIALVTQRYQGIQRLRSLVGDAAMAFQQQGGYEVFREHEAALYEEVLEQLPYLNDLLRPVFGQDAFLRRSTRFGMGKILPETICNPLEGQLNPGLMIRELIRKAQEANIDIFYGMQLLRYEDAGDSVSLEVGRGGAPGKNEASLQIRCKNLLLATNGFAALQAPELAVEPARAQVLITEPIPELHIKGTFHLEAGYYYFRNVGDRVLLGGGRNLDKAGETTTEFGTTDRIQEQLESLLSEVILPEQKAKIAQRWSGIMGVGPQKKPILRKLSQRVCCGVRLGGMGVAIGSHTGAALANLAVSDASPK